MSHDLLQVPGAARDRQRPPEINLSRGLKSPRDFGVFSPMLSPSSPASSGDEKEMHVSPRGARSKFHPASIRAPRFIV